ncbi:MAG: hypothetical protein Q9209_003934 [Squamulea sp. 1 TL-2023]
MFAVLSRYTNSFRYIPLGQSKLQLNTFRFFNSKRLAVLATAVLIVILLLATFHLATPGISHRRDGGTKDWSFESLPENVLNAVDWSRFAYTQYATNAPYLCNSLLLFETLHRLGSRAERLLLYPSEFEISLDGTDSQSWEGGLLKKARDEYNVTLKPIQTMDELFLLPPVPLALPRAYWLNSSNRVMSSQLLLIQPSEFEYTRVSKAINAAAPNDFDMEIVNNLYRDNALILPHRPYDLLTSEYRNVGNHKAYMGSEEEPFDPEAVLKEAKYLHFSDWPMPKVKISSRCLRT